MGGRLTVLNHVGTLAMLYGQEELWLQKEDCKEQTLKFEVIRNNVDDPDKIRQMDLGAHTRFP